ncbi:hypothetical protein 1 [Beihai picorna-like virus 118]|uniref:hypothetical protein 1 n=1 Tax=Beihai picorna-like virus 118 TaxID=1922547 RepID=UPI0009096F40|nr:hypothetical protein 1 [Beihai picorna-like virus 118]APG76746.1 hypothetical protein 1 [Beihai picorna-like virus 118]
MHSSTSISTTLLEEFKFETTFNKMTDEWHSAISDILHTRALSSSHSHQPRGWYYSPPTLPLKPEFTNFDFNSTKGNMFPCHHFPLMSDYKFELDPERPLDKKANTVQAQCPNEFSFDLASIFNVIKPATLSLILGNIYLVRNLAHLVLTVTSFIEVYLPHMVSVMEYLVPIFRDLFLGLPQALHECEWLQSLFNKLGFELPKGADKKADELQAQADNKYPFWICSAFALCAILIPSATKLNSLFSIPSVMKDAAATLKACDTITESLPAYETFVRKVATFFGFTFEEKELTIFEQKLDEMLKWNQKCTQVLIDLSLDPAVYFDRSAELIDFCVDGDAWEKWFMEQSKITSMAAHAHLLTTLKSERTKLRRLLQSYQKSISVKVEPTTLHIFGEPGLGKSHSASTIVSKLSAALKRPLTTYTRNDSDQYWSGYLGQDVVIYDDFASNAKGTSCSELMSIYTENVTLINKAALEEKGTAFTSPFVILLSNRFLPAKGDITNPDALARRRDVVVKIEDKTLHQLRNVEGRSIDDDAVQQHLSTRIEPDFILHHQILKDTALWPETDSRGQPIHMSTDAIVDKLVSLHRRKVANYQKKARTAFLSHFPDVPTPDKCADIQPGHPLTLKDMNPIGSPPPQITSALERIAGALHLQGGVEDHKLNIFGIGGDAGLGKTFFINRLRSHYEENEAYFYDDVAFSQEKFDEFIPKLHSHYEKGELVFFTYNPTTFKARLHELDADKQAAIKRRFNKISFEKKLLARTRGLVLEARDGKSASRFDQVVKVQFNGKPIHIEALFGNLSKITPSSEMINYDEIDSELTVEDCDEIIRIKSPINVFFTHPIAIMQVASRHSIGRILALVCSRVGDIRELELNQQIKAINATNTPLKDLRIVAFQFDDCALVAMSRNGVLNIKYLQSVSDEDIDDLAFASDVKIDTIQPTRDISQYLKPFFAIAYTLVTFGLSIKAFKRTEHRHYYDCSDNTSAYDEGLIPPCPSEVHYESKRTPKRSAYSDDVFHPEYPKTVKVKRQGCPTPESWEKYGQKNNSDGLDNYDEEEEKRRPPSYFVQTTRLNKTTKRQTRENLRHLNDDYSWGNSPDPDDYEGEQEWDALPDWESRKLTFPQKQFCVYDNHRCRNGTKHYKNLHLLSTERIGKDDTDEDKMQAACLILSNHIMKCKNCSIKSADILTPASHPLSQAWKKYKSLILHEVDSSFDKPQLQATVNPSLRPILQLIHANTIDLGMCKGLMLFDNFGVTTKHGIPGDVGDAFSVTEHAFKICALHPKKDLLFFQLKNKRSYRDIRKHIKSDDEVSESRNCILSIKTDAGHYLTPIRTTKIYDWSVKKSPLGETIHYTPVNRNQKLSFMLTMNGDCGSVGVTTGEGMSPKICLLHNAATTTCGYGVNILQSDLEVLHEAVGFPKEPQAEALKIQSQVLPCKEETDFEIYPARFQQFAPCNIPTEGHWTQVGTLLTPEGKVFKPFVASKTDLRPSPLGTFDDTGFVASLSKKDFQPAPLDRNDPRNPDKISILGKCVGKWDVQRDPINENPVNTAAIELGTWFAKIFKQEGYGLRTLTEHEVINGIAGHKASHSLNFKTSSGFPWKTRPGLTTKEGFFDKLPNGSRKLKDNSAGRDLRDAVNHIEAQARLGKQTGVVYCGQLKDEPRPRHKCEVLGTRSIAGGPICFQMAKRKKCHHFFANLAATRGLHPIKIGIVPSSYEWHELYTDINACSPDVFEYDSSMYDQSIKEEIGRGAGVIVDTAYRILDPDWTPTDSMIRDTYYRTVISGLYSIGSKVYRSRGGMPSGEPDTSGDDSLYHVLMSYIAFKIAMKRANRPDLSTPEQWYNLARLACYGDDGLQAVHPSIREMYGPVLFTEIWTHVFGMKVTRADKEPGDIPYIKVEDVEFLKRKFVPYRGLMLGGLISDSFSKMLTLTRVRKGAKYTDPMPMEYDPETISATIDSSIWEACLRGKDFYDKMVAHCSRIIDEYNLEPKEFLTHDAMVYRVLNSDEATAKRLEQSKILKF